jgi:hypothetical protein
MEFIFYTPPSLSRFVCRGKQAGYAQQVGICNAFRVVKLLVDEAFCKRYCSAGGFHHHAVIINSVPFIVAYQSVDMRKPDQ